MQKYLLSAQNVSWLIFSLIAAFVLIFWFAGFDGFYFYDDYQYSLDAFLFFKEKSVSSNDIFSHRLMVYIPVAIAYLLFGVNEFSTVLWPLLVSLASLWLVFFILRGKPWQPASIVLMGLSFYPLFFCNKLYPDSIVSFFCFLSVCILYKADEKKYFVTALAFALAVFCAFLSKETVIYFFPFYLILFISDLRRGYNKKFWVWTFVWTLSLSVIYFAFYKILTGSFFTRFYAIENGHYAFPLSYYSKPFAQVLPRLTYEPLLMLISSEMIVPLLIAFPVLVKLRWKILMNARTELNFWILLVITLLVMIWFGSTSVHFYNPVSLLPRMFILLIPPATVWAALSLEGSFQSKKSIMLISLLFMGCSMIALWQNYNSWFVYLLLGFLFMSVTFLMTRLHELKWKVSFIVLLMGVLAIHPVYSMIKPTQTGYFDEKKIIEKYLKGGEGSNMVVTDPQLCAGYLFYYKFKMDDRYVYLNYKNLPAQSGAEKYFVLINPYSLDLFHSMGDPYPKCYSQQPPGWKLIGEEGRVKLFEAGSIEEIKAGF